MTTDISLGFSSYSFHAKLSTGEMTLPQVIDWVAASEGEHLELASLGDDPDSPIPNIASPDAYVDEIRDHAADAGVPLTSLAIGADLSTGDRDQIGRVKAHVDLAERLGITRMRHDVAPHAAVPGDDTVPGAGIVGVRIILRPICAHRWSQPALRVSTIFGRIADTSNPVSPASH